MYRITATVIAKSSEGTSALLEQRRRKVALAGAGDDRDQHFALVFGTIGHLIGGAESGARGDAAQDALLLGRTAGPFEGVVVADANHVVNVFHVQVVGDEAAADALDLMWA